MRRGLKAKRTTIVMTPPVHKRLRRAKTVLGVNMHELVERAINLYLDKVLGESVAEHKIYIERDIKELEDRLDAIKREIQLLKSL